MSSRTFSPPRDRLHIEVFMMDQTTSIILDLIAPRQAVVDELFVQNFLLNYHPRRLRHGDRLVALGANHRPVQRFILGQGQIMNAVEDALRDRVSAGQDTLVRTDASLKPNEAMSVDDLERRLEARFAQKLRESEASLEERMMAKINEKDEVRYKHLNEDGSVLIVKEHRLATARMLRAADDREYARLSRIRRHRRNLVLFSFVIWLNCELRGPQQPISQTWSRTATDHAVGPCFAAACSKLTSSGKTRTVGSSTATDSSTPRDSRSPARPASLR